MALGHQVCTLPHGHDDVKATGSPPTTCGGCSSVGRASDCGSEGRGFKSPKPSLRTRESARIYGFSFVVRIRKNPEKPARRILPGRIGGAGVYDRRSMVMLATITAVMAATTTIAPPTPPLKSQRRSIACSVDRRVNGTPVYPQAYENGHHSYKPSLMGGTSSSC